MLELKIILEWIGMLIPCMLVAMFVLLVPAFRYRSNNKRVCYLAYAMNRFLK